MNKLKLYWLVGSFTWSLFCIISYFLFSPKDWLIIGSLSLTLTLGLGIAFFYINRWHNISLRNQLYQTLAMLGEFDVEIPTKASFTKSPFAFFNELNEYLEELIAQIRSNYQANKEFVQNASHELQTPLAIIRGHIELLLQSPNLSGDDIESLDIILQNTKRLSRLNTALILLSKIEHQGFSDLEKVNLRELCEALLVHFKDVIELKELEIRWDYQNEITCEINPYLGEILITNLLQNAIRHNLKKGFIQITLHEKSLVIANPGARLTVSPTILFNRFQRQSNLEESIGLGLSIVKKICDFYGFNLVYDHDGELHTLSINFDTNKISR